MAALGASALALGLPVVAAFTPQNPAAGRVEQKEAAESEERGLIRPFAIIVVVLFLGSLGQNGAVIHLSDMLPIAGCQRTRQR